MNTERLQPEPLDGFTPDAISDRDMLSYVWPILSHLGSMLGDHLAAQPEPLDLSLNDRNGPWCDCGQPLGHAVPHVDCTPSEPDPLDVERLASRLQAAVEALPGECHDGEGLGCDADPCVENVSRAAVLAIIEPPA